VLGLKFLSGRLSNYRLSRFLLFGLLGISDRSKIREFFFSSGKHAIWTPFRSTCGIRSEGGGRRGWLLIHWLLRLAIGLLEPRHVSLVPLAIVSLLIILRHSGILLLQVSITLPPEGSECFLVAWHLRCLLLLLSILAKRRERLALSEIASVIWFVEHVV